MTEFIRTPDGNFADLASFPFDPNYHLWQDLRVHYLDEGPRDGPVMLLVHGMPTWSYLYRDMIPGLVAAGYRCIAPDHLGFGRSDKPTDPHWYTIARHTEVLTSLMSGLELSDVTLVCQDWGGPIGLAQAMTMPERFSRIVIMNTWLHHEGYGYSDAVRSWNQNWHPGGLFDRERPDVALLPLLTAGLAGPDVLLPALVGGTAPELVGRAADEYRGYSAPFAGLPDAAFNGLRRFPLSIPFDDYDSGDGASDFLSNEYPLVRYAEEHGLDVSYVTDVTVDQHPSVLLQHRALLSLGHDETWSLNERRAAATAVSKGVNIVFFGAASVLRHVRMEPSALGPDRLEVDYRDATEDPLDGHGDPLEVTGNTWASPPASWSEVPLVGELYSGYLKAGAAVPFVVFDSSSWVFRGTGLHDGSALPGLIESDVDHLAPSGEAASDLQVLGHSPIPLTDIYTNQGTWGTVTYSDMTYYTDPTSKAGVLDTGDNNWINSLTPCPAGTADCPAGQVAAITGNILRLVGSGPAGHFQPSVPNVASVTPPGS